MVYDPTTGTIVLFGGADQNNGSVFGDTWTWDGVTWTEQFPPVSPSARSVSESMVFDPVSKNVLLFGGGDCCRTYYNDTLDVERRDLDAAAPCK
jgi:hypothetical protein